MNSRERVYRAPQFNKLDRAPRDLWAVPAIAIFRPSELDAVVARFPSHIILPVDTAGTAMSASGFFSEKTCDQPLFRYGPSDRAKRTAFIVGSYVDEWGCTWDVGEDGIVGEVKHPPLSYWKGLDSYCAPWEVLEGANWGDVDRIGASTDQFVLSPWHKVAPSLNWYGART